MDVKIAGSSPGGAAFEKFKLCRRSSTFVNNKFDIYSKIFFRDVGNFFRHLCELVLRHQMRVSNYFVNSFYSVYTEDFLLENTVDSGHLSELEKVRNGLWNPTVTLDPVKVSGDLKKVITAFNAMSIRQNLTMTWI